MQPREQEDISWYEYGRAAVLVGIQRAIKVLQDEVDDIKSTLVVSRSVSRSLETPEPKPRRRRKSSGWPSDPEARKAEGQRRHAVAVAKREARISNHPRDPRHPHHAAWIAKLRASQRKARKERQQAAGGEQ